MGVNHFHIRHIGTDNYFAFDMDSDWYNHKKIKKKNKKKEIINNNKSSNVKD